MNLLTCANGSTNKKCQIFLSCVMCHLSPVTCHQRQQRQPQTLPLLTSPLCTVLVHQDRTQKNLKIKNPNNHLNPLKTRLLVKPMLAIHSLIRGLQSTEKRGFHEETTYDNKQTLQLSKDCVSCINMFLLVVFVFFFVHNGNCLVTGFHYIK